ncbi:MAG: hypothetical protein BJ554DRAFT_7105 [Olpidium bornovanus]|uniref:Uncharacterized protein n=1 Tax=Olpidium bornovanus TaxID=278681 RepID=A0A8H7ZXF7_9FUNG|nr:MAG: hypothetical protein BJ554DRAFT_7105 [Olpidium bornovanus]
MPYNRPSKKFGVDEAKPIATPLGKDAMETLYQVEVDARPQEYAAAIGSLLWLATMTRPDIAFATSFLARFMAKPNEPHWGAIKRIMRYLKGTMEHGIKFNRGPKRARLEAFSDATGLFIAGSAVAQEVQWLRFLLHEMDPQVTASPTSIRIINDGAAELASNTKATHRSKHIEIKFHPPRWSVAEGTIKIWRVTSAKNPADIFIKPLDRIKFTKFREMLGAAAVDRRQPAAVERRRRSTGGSGREAEAVDRRQRSRGGSGREAEADEGARGGQDGPRPIE